MHKLIPLLAAVALNANAAKPVFKPLPPTTETISISVYSGIRNANEAVPVKIYAPSKLRNTLPAVLFMGNCAGQTTAAYQTTINELVAKGITVAEIESFQVAGRPDNVCEDKTSRLSGSSRAEEAFLVRDALVAKGLAKIDNVGLLGTSHGGWTITHAIYGDSTGFVKKNVPFKAAVAVYPWCHTMDVGSYKLQVPTLILIGSNDTWTTPARCVEMQRRTEGEVPLTLKIFQGATHSFDSDKPHRTAWTSNGPSFLKFNPDATVESMTMTLEFLTRGLELGVE